MNPEMAWPDAGIALAEDDAEDLFLILRALRRLRPGLAIRTARDGVELLEQLRSCAPAQLPALLLVDLNMPRMDGRELLRALRGEPRLAAIPVVVLTTSVEPEDRRRAAALGTAGYLSKPDSLAGMVSQFGSLLDRLLGPQPAEGP